MARQSGPVRRDPYSGGVVAEQKQRSVEVGRSSLGFVLLGGGTIGARVRDVRLINELVRRGHKCHVWWALERDRDANLDSRVQQRWLSHGVRYAGDTQQLLDFRARRIVNDLIGRALWAVGGQRLRERLITQYPQIIRWALHALIREVCGGVSRDAGLIKRFARELDRARVSHVFPMLAVLAPFVEAASRRMHRPARYAVTFQGYELYSPPARELGLEASFYKQLRLATLRSGYPPITVSRPYAERIEAEVGIPARDFAIIAPGIPTPKTLSKTVARQLVSQQLGISDFETPIVSYLGRQDSEKGLDLLLFATKLLQEKRVPFQLVICGPTAFGGTYHAACRQIAEHLGLPVMWHGFIANDVRSALMQQSHCLVYPSIHCEPFGMVPVEAMAQGTPVIVSDTGGVAELVKFGDAVGGLTFRSWDSGDLATKLTDLLADRTLHNRLVQDAPTVAANYSIGRMTDRVLETVEHFALTDDKSPVHELTAA